MKYPYNVYQAKVEDHVFWIADCPCLKGCTGQGETADAALAELEANETEWLKVAEEYGIDIPAVPLEEINDYSGKFTVRVAPYIHRKAAELAKKNNISLNQYVNDAIVAHNTSLSTLNYIVPEIKQAVSSFKEMLFYSAPTQSEGADCLRYFSASNSLGNYSVTTINKNFRTI